MAIPWSDPRLRLGSIVGAIVVLLAIGAALLRGGDSDTARLEVLTRDFLRAFDNRNAPAVARLFDAANGFSISGAAGPTMTSEQELYQRLEFAFTRLAFIQMRPQSIEVLPSASGNEAIVNLTFHWTVSGTMYPNLRTRSESYNPRGEPERATFRWVRRGRDWAIADLDVELQTR